MNTPDVINARLEEAGYDALFVRGLRAELEKTMLGFRALPAPRREACFRLAFGEALLESLGEEGDDALACASALSGGLFRSFG